MNAIEIVLLIIGFVCVCISFFVGNRHREQDGFAGVTEEGKKDIWTPKEEELIRQQMESILGEEKEKTIAETTEYLNRKSNEKIMEFDEFSTQLLEKINHNHEEVVFMYNLLSEKEKELKERAAASGRKKIDGDKKVAKAAASTIGASKPAKQAQTAQPLKSMKKTSPSSADISQNTAGNTAENTVENVEENGTENLSSTNQDIVRLYRQGKSVLEISKELNIGQGEVKLMIALYGGKK